MSIRHPNLIEDLADRIASAQGENLIIYGAGKFGEWIYAWLVKKGIKVSGFWDKDPLKQSKGKYGKKVSAPVYTGKEKIIIGTVDYEKEIIDYLLSIGIFEDRIIRIDHSDIFMDIENEYFDPEIIQFTENEIFVDAGARFLETSEQLLKKCTTVKKIYAFEPNEIPFNLFEFKNRNMGFDNIKIFKAGLWSDNTKLEFYHDGAGSSIIKDSEILNHKGRNVKEEEMTSIDVLKLDDAINDEVTFIKMDIEGAEYEALKGSEKTIKKYKPKLAICVYHRINDIIDIPLYIKSIVPGYKLYMRHYSNIWLDTVLYAVI